ncbi:MAG: CvpA family protein [Xanthomonadaceae bacterium]|nr:CvpA family protein [Xanthomonadaceae bacterium]MDE1885719.1 CvpA family protein [Xanthomonadaceae bacterium]MDE1960157.1 CvpA family protein [Xanthomonadaceae bacterium]MDE2085243.1 CvpA family protein [Xanthomonadaceae bacterium]
MNWADYCILAALGLSVLMGLARGFVGEVLALAGWVLAFWFAWQFGDALAARFTAIGEPSIRLLLGYGLCFLAVLLVSGVVGFLMRKLVAGAGLSGNDRLLGMVFGLVRGLALVTITVLLLGFTPLPRDPWWQQSRLLPAFQGYARWLSARLPPEALRYLDLRGIVPQIPAVPQKLPDSRNKSAT